MQIKMKISGWRERERKTYIGSKSTAEDLLPPAKETDGDRKLMDTKTNLYAFTYAFDVYVKYVCIYIYVDTQTNIYTYIYMYLTCT